MRITVLQEIAPLLCMSLATGAGKSRQLGAEPGLPMEAYGAGRFLGEWQTMPSFWPAQQEDIPLPGSPGCARSHPAECHVAGGQ